jgi:hypothetical protein
MKNILAVALVVSVASIALSQNPNPRPAEAPPAAVPGDAPAEGAVLGLVPVKTQKWEYKVSDRGGFEPGAWEKKLNDLAEEGWELDAIDEGHYILRRQMRRGAPGGGAGFF